MQKIALARKLDISFVVGIGFLVVLSLIVLSSVAPSLFPTYFLYLIPAIIVFWFLFQIDFEVISLFSKFFYIGSVVFLIIPLLIGQVTRGAIRWIPLGPLTIQPAELVRPFLLVFFANFLTAKEINAKRFFQALLLLALPVFLILIQPSLGVAAITVVGFVGVFLATNVPKKYFILAFLVFLALAPIAWQVLAPYQQERILTFVNPQKDPYGTGYNAIQSMISVGSGKLFGRGLGKGVQTQLAFLPERHSDFIFAAVAEEMGFLGAALLLCGGFFILIKLILILENASSYSARAFVAGLFLTLFFQTLVHVGMNLGLLPITGVPFPLVSAGGSSLLATFIGLAMALGAKRKIPA